MSAAPTADGAAKTLSDSKGGAAAAAAAAVPPVAALAVSPGELKAAAVRAAEGGRDGFREYRSDSSSSGSGSSSSSCCGDSESEGDDAVVAKQRLATFERVRNTYREMHIRQTVAFVDEMRADYGRLQRAEMTVWEAAELLNSIVDESDPDNDEPQIVHLLQTAEAIRAGWPDPQYDWLHLTGFVHDLGKILAHPRMGGLPQWAVVGDTFPVGCRPDGRCVFPEYFELNADWSNPRYNTVLGVYREGCGLRNLKMSWGHDEYMHSVCIGNGCTLPPAALAIIRFHSFYPLHRDNAYEQFLDDAAGDREMLTWIREFQKFDLYSKHDVSVGIADVERLRPYYEGLIAKYFGLGKLRW